MLPTFALVTAEITNPNVSRRKRLSWIASTGKQPFVRFNPRATFNRYSAIEVLCGKAATKETNWLQCSEQGDSDTSELQGKVVVVGDYLETDVHDSVLGLVYGVDLQANYIAALLADNVYVPLGDSLSRATCVAVWFALVQLLFIFIDRGWLAAVISIGIWILVFASSVFLLVFYGYLVPLFFQGITIVAILLTWVEHALSRKHTGRAQPTTTGDAADSTQTTTSGNAVEAAQKPLSAS